MDTSIRLLIGLVVAVAVAACGNGEDVPESAIGADTSAAAARQMLSPGSAADLGEPILTAAFEQVAPDTVDQITGTARLYPESAAADTAAAGGGFRLEVIMDGLSPGGHAWHIHRGTCESGGAIVVPFTDVPGMKGFAGPLNADAALSARGLVTISASTLPLQALQREPYSVRVHRGAAHDPGATVACADLAVT